MRAEAENICCAGRVDLNKTHEIEDNPAKFLRLVVWNSQQSGEPQFREMRRRDPAISGER